MTKMVEPSKVHDTSHPEQEDLCPECGSKKLIFDYDLHETACTSCGFTIRDERSFDRERLEKRVFSYEEYETRTRVGPQADITIHDQGAPTEIGRVDRDVFGKELPLSTRIQMRRLKKWQKRSRTRKKRTLVLGMYRLRDLKKELDVPKITHREAAVIFRKAYKKRLFRGYSIEKFAAAAFYAACRTTGIPRTLEQIAEAADLDRKDVFQCYKSLLKEFDYKPPPYKSITFINLIAEKLKISGPTSGKAIKLLKEAKLKGYKQGKSPMGEAAGALYLACLQNNEWKSQNEVAEAAGVSSVTVRNRYGSIGEVLGIDVKDHQRSKNKMRKQESMGPSPLDTATCINLIAERLKISEETLNDAIKLLKEAKLKGYDDKNFLGDASGVLYLTCLQNKEWRTQKEIAEVADVSAATVGDKYRSISRVLGIEKRKYTEPKKDKKRKRPMDVLMEFRNKVHIDQIDVIEKEARVLLQQVLNKRLYLGYSLADFTAAAFYAACRTTGIPRTLEQIAEAADLEKKNVAVCYKLLLKELNYKPPPPNPVAYINLIAKGLKISGGTRERAIEIYQTYKTSGIRVHKGGYSPRGNASAAVYIACSENGENKTQREIAMIAGITEVTVRNRYKAMKKALKITLPD